MFSLRCGRKTFEFGPCHVGINGTFLRGFYPDDERINVIATFEGLAEPVKVPNYNDMLLNAPHYPPDTDIVVGESTLKVHRHFLCMISSVFHAYFTHDSKEAQTGELQIDDFEFQTVKNVVDHCQGRDIPDLSLQEAFDLLRFADKKHSKRPWKTA
uniref:BTB domain-containing protein n=1 Tax=Panagrellus redivivus TaxID=6233 RepID=A0A7E4VDU7_PANRE